MTKIVLCLTFKYLGGIGLLLFRRYLKDFNVLAFLIYSGRLFQAFIVEGKNELKKIFVLA